jgi:hypothetical protein
VDVQDEMVAMYRKRAAELRVVAAAMTEEAARQAMLDVAATYEKLVEQLIVLRSYGTKAE